MHIHSGKTPKIILLAFMLACLVFVYISPTQVQAQAATGAANYASSGADKSITAFLCTPTESNGVPSAANDTVLGIDAGTTNINPAGSDLYNCINKLYRFGIAFGAIAGIFFIVLAGYYYISGSEAAISKAKTTVGSVIIGLLIMLTSFILLKQINPDLVRFRPIQPPEFTDPCPGNNPYGPGGSCELPSCENAKLGELCRLANGDLGTADGNGNGTPIPGGKPVVGGGCNAVESGSCTRQVISACPAMAQNMDNALRACNQESQGGRPAIASGTDQCTEQSTGKKISFSWGLWQINIAAGSYGAEFPECNGVLRESGGPWSSVCLAGTCGRMCSYGSGGEAAFNRCVQGLSNPTRNTRQACTLFNQRGWRPWPYTRRVCGLP